MLQLPVIVPCTHVLLLKKGTGGGHLYYIVICSNVPWVSYSLEVVFLEILRCSRFCGRCSWFSWGVPGFLVNVPGFGVLRDVPVFRCSGVPCSVFRCS